MSDSLPSRVERQIADVKAAVQAVDDLLGNQLQSSSKQADESLTPLQRAYYHYATAQALVHVYSLLLRTQGLESSQHPVQKEHERLKHYEKKISKLESADYLARHKPSININIAAANRFIDNALPDLTKDQKNALRQVGKRKAQDTTTLNGEGPADFARHFLNNVLSKKTKQ